MHGGHDKKEEEKKELDSYLNSEGVGPPPVPEHTIDHLYMQLSRRSQRGRKIRTQLFLMRILHQLIEVVLLIMHNYTIAQYLT